MSEQISTERLTRSLAYMLRHQPDEFDIEVDKYGFADLEDVLDELSDRFDQDIEVEDLTKAIDGGDRPRYEIVDGKIRALYGHSIEVDPGESTEPPEKLFLGMGSRDADRASRNGLNAGRRRFLHLATSEDDAKEMGRRAAPEYTVVTVFARDAWEDGVSFYDRKALFLSEAIPTDHLEVGEVFTDGEQRDRGGRGRRGGRGGRGNDRGGRGNDRGGRGNDRGGRGDDRGGRDDRRQESRKDSERSSGGDRRPARREEAPERKAEEREAAKPTAKAKSSAGGFGLGLDAASAPEPKPERKPEPKSEPAKPAAKSDPDPGPSFGGGL